GERGRSAPPSTEAGAFKAGAGSARTSSRSLGRNGADSAAGGAGVPEESIVPTEAPTATVSPSLAPIFNTPELGAGTRLVALSVSSSKIGSPAWTAEPSALSQRARIPSEIDSPTLGTVIGTADMVSSLLALLAVQGSGLRPRRKARRNSSNNPTDVLV